MWRNQQLSELSVGRVEIAVGGNIFKVERGGGSWTILTSKGADGPSHVQTSFGHQCFLNPHRTQYVNSKVDFFHFTLDLKTNMQKTSHFWGTFFGWTLDELSNFHDFMVLTWIYMCKQLSYIHRPGCLGFQGALEVITWTPHFRKSQKWRNLEHLSTSRSHLDPGSITQLTILSVGYGPGPNPGSSCHWLNPIKEKPIFKIQLWICKKHFGCTFEVVILW